jgi:hypothetical protein
MKPWPDFDAVTKDLHEIFVNQKYPSYHSLDKHGFRRFDLTKFRALLEPYRGRVVSGESDETVLRQISKFLNTWRDSFGMLLVHYVVIDGDHEDFVELLLELGQDPGVKNWSTMKLASGMSAAGWAATLHRVRSLRRMIECGDGSKKAMHALVREMVRPALSAGCNQAQQEVDEAIVSERKFSFFSAPCVWSTWPTRCHTLKILTQNVFLVVRFGILRGNIINFWASN